MTRYTVRGIQTGCFFSKPAYLDNGFIITAPEIQLSQGIVQILTEWEFREIQSEGEILENYVPSGVSLADESGKPVDKGAASDGDQLGQAEIWVRDFQKYVENLFTVVSIKNDLVYKNIQEKMRDVCEVIKDQRRFLLRVLRDVELSAAGSNYLSSHTVKSTIIAVVIGIYLKLPNHRLIELGISSLLHEIGMIKLPPQIYLNKRSLTPQERKVLMTHPVLSYNMLKSFDCPLNISLAALEHHERENGEGYPQKLTGDKISLYAKVIAVACSYEARPD
ncbi:hypothetical protein FACS1894151_11680 [Spirochaetia bacterium]|nr:hypothetical protein FACS1894151_11680 [Spirochaetia bacterium]